MHVDGVGGVPLTVGQARRLAAEIMAAADSLAAICPDPADPLDGVSFVALLDELACRATANTLDRANGVPLHGRCDDCGLEHWRGECEPLSVE